jgi:putative transposase
MPIHTHDGRQLKLVHVVDEHSREGLAMRVGRSWTADEVIDVLDRLVA